jgi:hypothetical protein
MNLQAWVLQLQVDVNSYYLGMCKRDLALFDYVVADM